MNSNELNIYIEKYVLRDKTNSALMLSGAWGIGKSFYIKNDLIPYLEENRKCCECIVVSSYGYNTIDELAKAIYKANSSNTIARTIKSIQEEINSKNISSKMSVVFPNNININLIQNDDVFSKEIYLEGKLLIIEDIERSKIDVLDILGYVNHLTEYFNVKVLLIADESKLIKFKNQSDNKNKVFTEETEEYLRKKEKTIRETLPFLPNINCTLDKILRTFEHPDINSLLNEKDQSSQNTLISELIFNVISKCSNFHPNFRSIIFGVQKTIDMFEIADFSYKSDFFKEVLFGNIAYSIKMRDKGFFPWTDKENGATLATKEHPLLKISYDYFIFNDVNSDDIKEAHDYYFEQIKELQSNKMLSDCLEVIFDYYDETEEKLNKAIKTLLTLIKKGNIVKPSQFTKIANYLINIKDVIGFSSIINDCLDNMEKQVIFVDKTLDDQIRFSGGIVPESSKSRDEFAKFREKLLKKSSKIENIFDFNYKKENLYDWLESIKKNRNYFVELKKFASLFDTEKLCNLIKDLLPFEIGQIRSAFHSVYSFSNLGDFFSCDFDSLIDLRKRLNNVFEEALLDKVALLQIKYFISNLDDFIERLNVNRGM